MKRPGVRCDFSLAPVIFGLLTLCGSCAGPGAAGAPSPSVAPAAHLAPTGVVRAVASVALGGLVVRKWQLDNGLEIVTIPDADVRSVTMVTALRVGSRDDDVAAGETGLAHLCEHLMFAHAVAPGNPGTGAEGDFDQQIEALGGSSNAQTGFDFTSYTDDIPSQGLERTIRLEADRMANLTLDPAQVAREREVVIAERLETVEDSVDGTLDELMYGQAFPSHPYGSPTIGRLGDIKAVTRERVLAFYHRHYAPNRTVVVLGGRFEEASALEMLRTAFGILAARNQVEAVEKALGPTRQPPARASRTTIVRPLAADRIVIGFPAPSFGDPDRTAYEVLAEVLAGGPSSRLSRLLVVQREIASSVTSDVAPTRDPGLWSIWVQMTKGHPAAEAEALIAREIERVVMTPVSPAELDAVKRRLETGFWQRLESNRARAEAVAIFDATTGDFRDLVSRGPAYERITADELRRVAHVYLASDVRSVVIAHPRNGGVR